MQQALSQEPGGNRHADRVAGRCTMLYLQDGQATCDGATLGTVKILFSGRNILEAPSIIRFMKHLRSIKQQNTCKQRYGRMALSAHLQGGQKCFLLGGEAGPLVQLAAS